MSRAYAVEIDFFQERGEGEEREKTLPVIDPARRVLRRAENSPASELEEHGDVVERDAPAGEDLDGALRTTADRDLEEVEDLGEAGEIRRIFGERRTALDEAAAADALGVEVGVALGGPGFAEKSEELEKIGAFFGGSDEAHALDDASHAIDRQGVRIELGEDREPLLRTRAPRATRFEELENGLRGAVLRGERVRLDLVDEETLDLQLAERRPGADANARAAGEHLGREVVVDDDVDVEPDALGALLDGVGEGLGLEDGARVIGVNGRLFSLEPLVEVIGEIEVGGVGIEGRRGPAVDVARELRKALLADREEQTIPVGVRARHLRQPALDRVGDVEGHRQLIAVDGVGAGPVSVDFVDRPRELGASAGEEVFLDLPGPLQAFEEASLARDTLEKRRRALNRLDTLVMGPSHRGAAYASSIAFRRRVHVDSRRFAWLDLSPRAWTRHQSPMSLRVVFAPFVLLFRLLFAPLRAFRRARAAPAGALVELTLRGTVHEGPPRPAPRLSLARLLRRNEVREAIHLPVVRALVDEVIADPRVAGLVVTLHGLAGGWASLEALREELVRVRAAGKRLVAWLPEGGGNGDVYLATAASTVVAPKTVDIALTGVKSARTFFRRPLEQLGVDVELHARKDYKSAADGFARDNRSPGDREQTEVLVGALHDALLNAIAEGRGIDLEAARALVDAGPTRAAVAKERGLVDLLGHDDDLPALLDARIVPAGSYLRARRATKLRPFFARPVIGVVEVHGNITSGGSPLARAFGALALQEQVVADLRAAERDSRVVGVILDVDSRGGSVTASDAIFAAVERLAEKKPVIARMGDVAASGGYYVAAGAHAIVARPLTITGSIGVVSARPVVARILEKYGVVRDVIARGRFADLGTLARVHDAEEEALLAREIDGHYDAFVSLVAAARKRSVEEIEPLARGRVWTGADAKERGLVDHLGGFTLATQLVRDALKEKGAKVIPVSDPVVVAARLPSRRLTAPTKSSPSAGPLAALAAMLEELDFASLLPGELRLLGVALASGARSVLAYLP